jgi:hypothetical protein
MSDRTTSREARISVGSSCHEWQDLAPVPIPLPAAVEHQGAQRGYGVHATMPRDVAPLLVPGSIACLAKPFAIDDLLACVACYVQPSQVEDQQSARRTTCPASAAARRCGSQGNTDDQSID